MKGSLRASSEVRAPTLRDTYPNHNVNSSYRDPTQLSTMHVLRTLWFKKLENVRRTIYGAYRAS